MEMVLLPRVPTKRMLRAASKAMSPGRRPTLDYVSNQQKHAIRYTAMVDAFLETAMSDPTDEQIDAAATAFSKCEGDLHDSFRAALIAATKAAPLPQPRRNDGGAPCGECHLKPGETCDVCGAAAPQAAPEPVDGTYDAYMNGFRDGRQEGLAASPPMAEPVETYFARQIEWSKQTFGPDLRTGGVIDHIRKELREIEAQPHDLSEWIDVVILAMDGYWRHGGKAEDLMPSLLAKQRKNMARTWPDWRAMSTDKAIEHDRSEDAPMAEPVVREAALRERALDAIAAREHMLKELWEIANMQAFSVSDALAMKRRALAAIEAARSET